MTRAQRLAFAVGFFVVLGGFVVAWALTIDQIWTRVYDSTNHALRLNRVAG